MHLEALPTVLVSGTVGSGKTSVADEIAVLLLEGAAAEDFTVANDERPVRDVALEVLTRLDWPTP